MVTNSKPKIVISTIGTSLLTNQVDRNNPDEKSWQTQLRDEANLSLENTSVQVKELIDELRTRAENQLQKGIPQVRRASAELNGIYGLYDDDLSSTGADVQWLIATDTAQGYVTAEIVGEFLRQQGLSQVHIYTPPGLSMSSTENFTEGVDNLISWLQETIEPLRDSYQVIFNLVGGFKALQGYMNTIGMFHADEIIYIFEGVGAQLIKIPRLPVQIDTGSLEPHKVLLALASEHSISQEEATGIPEIMLGKVDDRFILSTWGRLIWLNIRQDTLSQDLLALPRIIYTDSFKSDYGKVKNAKERCKLQETLVKVAVMLKESNGDPATLKADGGLQYDKYVNKGGIDHFRITQGIRVSCESENGQLVLRRYGNEPDVNKNP